MTPPLAPVLEHRTPVLAEGVELLGELSGSGHVRTPGLVRRGDGVTVQVTPVLYALLGLVDGRRDLVALADGLGEALDRTVAPEDVEFLVAERLGPLGVLRGEDGSEPAPDRPDPLLGLKARLRVTDPAVTARLVAPLTELFRPWAVLPVLFAFVTSVWWLFTDKGLGSAARQAIYSPGLLLVVLGITIASAAFHELGHAAACRYGGARPGAMGAGFYLVWPAFYTDVDDSYRLSRWGRLRVDLGGLYFNAVAAVAITGAWIVFDTDALLLGVAVQLLQMLRQLIPVIRADGYHLLADITGVPDLFAHLGPTLRAALPDRWGKPQPVPLRRWARVVVTVWVVLVTLILGAVLTVGVYLLPRLAATAWDSATLHAALIRREAAAFDAVAVLAGLASLMALLLPVAGTVYLTTRIVRRAWSRSRFLTDGKPRARAAVLVAWAVLVALVLASWMPDSQRTPVSGTDRGTVSDLLEPIGLADERRDEALAARPAVALPADTVVLARGSDAKKPAAGDEARPSPAVSGSPVTSVQQASSGPAAKKQPAPEPSTTVVPGPVAPVAAVVENEMRFQLPAPPKAGDNQALSVGRIDGRSVVTVATDLQLIRDGASVRNTNSAWALASCTDCTTVAVASQVVLVVGNSRVQIPVNTAAAGNDRCTRCRTTAIAGQVVLTLKSEPSGAVLAQVRRAQAGLNSLNGQAKKLTDSEVAARVRAAEQQVLDALLGAGLVDFGTKVAAPTTNTAVPTVDPTVEPLPSADTTVDLPEIDVAEPTPSVETVPEPTTTPTEPTTAPTEPVTSTPAPSPDPQPSPSTSATDEPTPTSTTEPSPSSSSSPPASPEPSPT